ncbi:hypothetical protein [Nitratidesulfovibrio termitidis]|uniref:hypothetical protein n=1 Tax=Nitratidesulfovibrio termitidis TaxID=42252 RepID=UPI0012EBBD5E|nr:hypothetical protein [Nitratidesulfovibrio termitidis]
MSDDEKHSKYTIETFCEESFTSEGKTRSTKKRTIETVEGQAATDVANAVIEIKKEESKEKIAIAKNIGTEVAKGAAFGVAVGVGLGVLSCFFDDSNDATASTPGKAVTADNAVAIDDKTSVDKESAS